MGAVHRSAVRRSGLGDGAARGLRGGLAGEDAGGAGVWVFSCGDGIEVEVKEEEEGADGEGPQ